MCRRKREEERKRIVFAANETSFCSNCKFPAHINLVKIVSIPSPDQSIKVEDRPKTHWDNQGSPVKQGPISSRISLVQWPSHRHANAHAAFVPYNMQLVWFWWRKTPNLDLCPPHKSSTRTCNFEMIFLGIGCHHTGQIGRTHEMKSWAAVRVVS